MKRFSIILLALISICLVAALFSSCGTTETKPETVRIAISYAPEFEGTPDWVIPVQSTPPFIHVYDSVTLLTTNNSTNVQATFGAKTNFFSVVLTEGDYNLYMSTKDPKVVESYLHFTANTQSANVVKGGQPIVLTGDTKQALLLVTKTAVDAAPKITITGKVYTMFSGTNHYYAYIKAQAPTTVNLSMVISGKTSARDVIVNQKNRYLVTNPTNATITTEDFITNVIEI